MNREATTCAWCGGPIEQSKRGAPKRYCGATCRVAAHRAPRAQACVVCGDPSRGLYCGDTCRATATAGPPETWPRRSRAVLSDQRDNLGRRWPKWAKGIDSRSNMAPPPGYVAATCWCEADVVWIAPADVGVRTDSCGRPGCQSPATTSATS